MRNSANIRLTLRRCVVAVLACLVLLVVAPSVAFADDASPGALQAQELVAGEKLPTDDWLAELRFGTRTDPTDERFASYQIEPEFDPEVHEYTLYVPDTDSGIYGYGTSLLAESGSTGANAVLACFTDTRGTEQEINLGTYSANGNFSYLTRCIARGAMMNEIVIQSPNGTADYTVHVRRVVTLMSLRAQVAGGESELFSSDSTEYDLAVPLNCAGEQLVLTPQAYYYDVTDDGNDLYTVKVQGETVPPGGSYAHTLTGNAEDLQVEVSWEQNRSTVYTVHVFPADAGGAVRFDVRAAPDSQSGEVPQQVSVKVFNAHGAQMQPDADDPMRFSGLFVGSDYTYKATAPGWRSTTGSFTATSDEQEIPIVFGERSKGVYLDDLMVYPNGSGSVAGNYPLQRAEDLDAALGARTYTVTYSSQQTSDALYLAAVLSDSAPEGTRIRVSAWGLDGERHSMWLPDSDPGLPVRRTLGARTFEAGPKRAVYYLDVGVGDDVERYAVVVLRDLQLASLQVSREPGGAQLLEQDFKRSIHDYDVSVMDDVGYLFVAAEPFGSLEDAVVRVDGEVLDGDYALVMLEGDRLQDVRVEMACPGTYDDPDLEGLEYESVGLYTVHVERLTPVDVSFEVDPEDAIVSVYDRRGDRVQSSDGGRTFPGVYGGRTYSYTVTRYGCVGEKGTFVAEDGLVVRVSLDGAPTVHPELTSVEWWNYRNSYENNGVTWATTPDSPGNAALKWQARIGGDYGSSVSPPLVADGCLYAAAGKFVYKMDKSSGQVLAVSDELAGDVVYALNSMTYAEGMLFVQIGRGRVQALSATTLRSLWVSESVGGQTLSPITYRNGYLFTGTWNSESKPGEFVSMSVTDEDPSRGDEEKLTSWRLSRAGGFYWAGAYVSEDSRYVLFGTDDGENEGNYTGTASLVSVEPFTGEVIDRLDGVRGDVRSSIVYDGGYAYFVTKGGLLYRVQVNGNGSLGGTAVLELGGMSTSSPVVHNGRVYVGVCGEGGQFNADGGHMMAVVSSDARGLSLAYTVETPGFPQAAALLTTAYEDRDFDVDGTADGRVYVYFTCNARPGGIYVLADEPGQGEGEAVELWAPDSAQQQYCISPICTDSEGTLYYKNDSGYLFAVTANDAYLLDAELAPPSGEARWDAEFDMSRLGYRVMVPNESAYVAVTLKVPTGRRVTVNGQAYKAGMHVPLATDGTTTRISAVVTYKGKSRTYSFDVEPLGVDASLSELFCSTSNNALQVGKRLALSPEFDPAVAQDEQPGEYVAAECDSDRKFVNLWAVPAGSYADVQVEGVSGVAKINVFRNAAGSYGRTRYAVYFGQDEARATVRVTVTAGDGVTKRTYDVVLCRRDVFAPKIEQAVGHRLSADDAAVLFQSNEGGTYAWAVTSADANAPARPDGDAPGEGVVSCGTAELVAGANRLELAGIGDGAHAVWLWATDAAGNASGAPVRVDVAAWREFDLSLSVSPADASVTVVDASGAEVAVSGTGANRSVRLVEGNTYTLTAERTGHVRLTDRFVADSSSASYEVKLEDLRSKNSQLKGLYVSSSAKWGSGLQKLSPKFDSKTARYEAAYNGQRTHLYVWPVVADSKSQVKVYAVGGVRADTVAKDETIKRSELDGRPCWKVYFAKDCYEAEVRIRVTAEDGSTTDYFATLSIRDATAPVLSRVSASRVSVDRASVVLKTSEQGRYWYVVAKKGDKAPEVKTTGAGAKMAKGTVTVSLAGLSKGEYVLYAVAADSVGNKSKVVKVPIPDSRNGGSCEGGNGNGGSGGSGGWQRQSGAAGTPNGRAGTTSATGGTITHEGGTTSTQERDGTTVRDGATTATAATDGNTPTNSTGVIGDPNAPDGTGAPDQPGNALAAQLQQIASEIPPWAAPFAIFAGLGLLYLLFWAYSVRKRRREVAAAKM